MDDVIALVDRVRVRTARLNEESGAKFALESGDPPIAGFNMANQYAVIALELLTFYRNVWSAIPAATVSNPERSRRENGERVLTITKAAFILTVSAFEFSAKQAITTKPGKLPTMEGRTYLRRIMAESLKAGIIPPTDATPWEAVSEVRNVLVHNNGIADRTVTYEMPLGPTVVLATGAMTQGNLRFFPELSLWCVEAFARWCDGYLS